MKKPSYHSSHYNGDQDGYYFFFYERDQDSDWGTDGNLDGSLIISYDFDFMIEKIHSLLKEDIKSFRGKDKLKESLETSLRYLSTVLDLGGTKVTTIKGSYELTIEYSLEDERLTFYFELGNSYLHMGIAEVSSKKAFLKLF